MFLLILRKLVYKLKLSMRFILVVISTKTPNLMLCDVDYLVPTYKKHFNDDSTWTLYTLQ
jgi:hypothetical protein